MLLFGALACPAWADLPKRLGPVPLSTNGGQIIGADGSPVRILSVGMWLEGNDVGKVAGIAAAGFNAIRLAWTNRQMNRMADLDRVIAAAGKLQLKVILDNHSNEGGAPGPWKPCYAQQLNGLWYDLGGASDNTDGCQTPGTVSDARFIADWQAVARHFLNNPSVVGYDLRNEPLAYPGMSTWEEGDRNPTHNIRFMYERAGNAIHAIDPTKLIICEGPLNAQRSFADPNTPAPWGDLSLAGKYPVNLSVPHKLVYSVHDYPAEIGGYRPDCGADKVAQMNKVWGYLVRDRIAPVWIGEMGATMNTDAHRKWARTLIDYANGRLGAQGGPTFGPGEQGIGISWWFAGHDAHSKPTGIFDVLGNIDPLQHETYMQFRHRQ